MNTEDIVDMKMDTELRIVHFDLIHTIKRYECPFVCVFGLVEVAGKCRGYRHLMLMLLMLGILPVGKKPKLLLIGVWVSKMLVQTSGI